MLNTYIISSEEYCLRSLNFSHWPGMQDDLDKAYAALQHRRAWLSPETRRDRKL